MGGPRYSFHIVIVQHQYGLHLVSTHRSSASSLATKRWQEYDGSQGARCLLRIVCPLPFMNSERCTSTSCFRCLVVQSHRRMNVGNLVSRHPFHKTSRFRHPFHKTSRFIVGPLYRYLFGESKTTCYLSPRRGNGIQNEWKCHIHILTSPTGHHCRYVRHSSSAWIG